MGAEVGIIGISKIQMGATGVNGAMGATLTDVGDLLPDSVNLVFDEPGKTDLPVEGKTSPWATIPDLIRAKRLEFTSRNVDPATLARAFGGTVINGTRWQESIVPAIIEQSVTAESVAMSGFKRIIYIPKGVIRASLDGKMQSKDSAAIKFIVDINGPTDAGGNSLAGIYIDKVVVP
jgi:hypothetical protein